MNNVEGHSNQLLCSWSLTTFNTINNLTVFSQTGWREARRKGVKLEPTIVIDKDIDNRTLKESISHRP